ncbi:cation diffusion facilitator family transporter [Alkalimarinus sediminis]|nr:cation diffusion facilitator family transporter [Alkalimarinus sediminis]
MKVAIGSGIFMVVLALFFSIIAQSEALLLDGLFSFINMIMALITLQVSRLISRPNDSRYHFGYWSYEPLLNLAKGSLITIVSLFALGSAIIVLIDGGRHIEADMAMIYAVIATSGCLLVHRYLKQVAKECNSPIIAVDAHNWLIDGVISGAVALAFVVVYLLESMGVNSFTPYADPVLVILLVCGTIPIPLRIIRDNWRQIIGHAPHHETQLETKNCVDSLMSSIPVSHYNLRMSEIGRLLYIQLYLVSDTSMTIAETDLIRERLYDKLNKQLEDRCSSLAVDFIFCTDDQWVKRSTHPDELTNTKTQPDV